MRELKFRAWDIDCHRFEYFEIGENDDCYGMFRVAANKFGSVVEQYTGLKDKNGKEIYEGDIVKFKWTKRLYVVAYRLYDASFILENDEWEETIHLSLDKDNYEVIGNIHENPELLEEEE